MLIKAQVQTPPSSPPGALQRVLFSHKCQLGPEGYMFDAIHLISHRTAYPLPQYPAHYVGAVYMRISSPHSTDSARGRAPRLSYSLLIISVARSIAPETY